jgi:hypothetical protein
VVLQVVLHRMWCCGVVLQLSVDERSWARNPASWQSPLSHCANPAELPAHVLSRAAGTKPEAFLSQRAPAR